MSVANLPLQYNANVHSRLRIVDMTKASGPVGVGGFSPVVYHEYGFQLVQAVASNPTGAGIAGNTTINVYGSLNGRDFELLGQITIASGAGVNRTAGHIVLSGVWAFVAYEVAAVPVAGTVVEAWAQPVAGNLN